MKRRPGAASSPVGRLRHAALVEHAEVPDHRLQPAAVAGRRDHGVGLDAAAVGEARRRRRRATRRRATISMRRSLIASMTSLSTIAGATPSRISRANMPSSGRRQAVLGQVADLQAPDQRHDAVGPLRAQLEQAPREQRPERGADQDVRGRAHRQPHAPGAAVDQVVGDLHAGAARPDDEHVAVPEGLRVAVVGRVQQLPAEAIAAGPVGDERACARSRSTRSPAPPRRSPAEVRSDQPLAVAVDALHARVHPHVERIVARVVLEVADHLVARGKRRRRRARGAAPGGSRTSGSSSAAAGRSGRARRRRPRSTARARSRAGPAGPARLPRPARPGRPRSQLHVDRSCDRVSLAPARPLCGMRARSVTIAPHGRGISDTPGPSRPPRSATRSGSSG